MPAQHPTLTRCSINICRISRWINALTSQWAILVLGSKGNWCGCLLHKADFSVFLKRTGSRGCKLVDPGAKWGLWICLNGLTGLPLCFKGKLTRHLLSLQPQPLGINCLKLFPSHAFLPPGWLPQCLSSPTQDCWIIWTQNMQMPSLASTTSSRFLVPGRQLENQPSHLSVKLSGSG